jgi:hypothetical protein
VDFYRDWQTGAGTTAISLGLIVWGEFSVLCIASASMRLTMRVEYKDGGMVGTGNFSVSIKICWCFTLRVSQTVQQQFAGGSKNKSVQRKEGSRMTTDAVLPAPGMKVIPEAELLTAEATLIKDAIDEYFDTLAIDGSIA